MPILMEQPEVEGGPTLGNNDAESTLFRKVEAVEKDINDVRVNAKEILIQLKNLIEDHIEMKDVLKNIESTLFGHNVNAGLMTRIEILEQNEKRRTFTERNKTAMYAGLWVAITLLILDRVFTFLVNGQP